MNLLIYDNYDSFTYNLVHIVRELGYDGNMQIKRNDKIEIEEIQKFDKILLSPGPGIPEESGNMIELIRTYGTTKSILGVCLGHQGIAEAFGGKIFNMKEVFHGVATKVNVTAEEKLFRGLPASFFGARYHSWSVDRQNPGNEIDITSVDDDGEIMSLRHRKYDVAGLQFHPESVISEHGTKILENWLNN
jgi:anthranilate synthase component 2